MSEKNVRIIRKTARTSEALDRRQSERERTLQRRRARYIKAVIRSAN
ncbi:hypothetical protein [Kitasatospora aureofaciens]